MNGYELELNGVLLTFDADDADEIERLENALALVGKEEKVIADMKKDDTVKNSAVMRTYCKMYREFFTVLFGEETTAEIFKEVKATKFAPHEAAYIQFMGFVFAQKTALNDKNQELLKKYYVRK
jgi:hypothetical protein